MHVYGATNNLCFDFFVCVFAYFQVGEILQGHRNPSIDSMEGQAVYGSLPEDSEDMNAPSSRVSMPVPAIKSALGGTKTPCFFPAKPAPF